MSFKVAPYKHTRKSSENTSIWESLQPSEPSQNPHESTIFTGSAWAQKVVKTSPKSTRLGPSLAPTSEKWPSWSASKKRTKNTSEIMLKCLQKGSPNKRLFWGFWLFGVTQMTFSGILRAWFPPKARFWANLRSNSQKSDENMLPGQHVRKFDMQNESRQHPPHGETAFEISCIGKCLHTLTNIYSRAFGTTFT